MHFFGEVLHPIYNFGDSFASVADTEIRTFCIDSDSITSKTFHKKQVRVMTGRECFFLTTNKKKNEWVCSRTLWLKNSTKQ